MSSLKFAADENLNGRILRALEIRCPDLDILHVRGSPADGEPDDVVLEWVAGEGRVLITHDVRTMPAEAWARVRDGRAMPGILVIPWSAPSGPLLAELVPIVTAGVPEDLRDRVLFLPSSGAP